MTINQLTEKYPDLVQKIVFAERDRCLQHLLVNEKNPSAAKSGIQSGREVTKDEIQSYVQPHEPEAARHIPSADTLRKLDGILEAQGIKIN